MPGRRKLDLLGTCSATIPIGELKELWCTRCKNPECVNAGWAESKWHGRMLTQVDRLLDHPSFADIKDPRWKEITNLGFLEIKEPISIVSEESWDGPGVHLSNPDTSVSSAMMVDQAVAALSGKEIKPMESPKTAEHPMSFMDGGAPPDPVKPQETTASNKTNTDFPDEGLMIDGSTPSTPAVQKMNDPWSTEASVRFVPAGAKIRMG